MIKMLHGSKCGIYFTISMVLPPINNSRACFGTCFQDGNDYTNVALSVRPLVEQLKQVQAAGSEESLTFLQPTVVVEDVIQSKKILLVFS